MSKGFSVFTAFKAKDGLTPAFKSMTRGANIFETKINRLKFGTKNFGSVIQNTCGKLNAFMNIAVGFIAFDRISEKINSVIDSASDLQETIGKTGEVFKGNSVEVEKWSKTSIKSMGLAEQTALDTASLFGDMGTGMGMTTKRAADMSMNLTQLSADLASFKNVEQGLATNALKGIFTGETEALKNMGVVMTESVLQEYARANGIRKKMKDMTQAEKIELRYQYVMKSTKNAQGDFIRTFGNYANQKRIGEQLKKQAEINIGKILLPVWNKFMVLYNTFFTNNLDNITKTFQKFFNYLKGLFVAMRPVFNELKITFSIFKAEIGPAITNLAPLFKNVFEGVLVPGLVLTIAGFNKLFETTKNLCSFLKSVFIPVLPILTGFLTGLTVYKTVQFFQALQIQLALLKMQAGGNLLIGLKNLTLGILTSTKAVMAQNLAYLSSPLFWIPAIIAAVVAGVILLWKNWDKVTESVKKCAEWLSESTFGKIISCIFPFLGVLALVINNWDLIINKISQFWTKCVEVFTAFKTFFKNNFVHCILGALGPVGWLILGVKKLGSALGGLGNNKFSFDNSKTKFANIPTQAPINKNIYQNISGTSGIIEVRNIVENKNNSYISSNTNLINSHNLKLNPA